MTPRTLVSATALGAALGLALALPAAAAQPTNPDRRLVEAAQRKDSVAVQTLIGEPVDVDTPQADGATPLAWAVHWTISAWRTC